MGNGLQDEHNDKFRHRNDYGDSEENLPGSQELRGSHWALTFEMRGGARLAGRRPLD